MNRVPVSSLLLERYHLGEVTPEEKRYVEEALAGDLPAALAKLDYENSDFFQRYPKEKIFSSEYKLRLDETRRFKLHRLKKIPPLVWGFCAAALVLVIALPMFILKNPTHEEFSDRMKGVSGREPSNFFFSENSDKDNSIELSVYVRGNPSGEIVRLTDQAGVREGYTIQLVYSVPDDNSGDKHGVIFSIDGRSFVTLHYPYNQRQSTQLVSGRNVPLDEAYTLDDAPDYEIFFFVISDKQIDVSYILNTAQQLAYQIKENPEDALEIGSAVFKDYDVNVFTLRKDK